MQNGPHKEPVCRSRIQYKTRFINLQFDDNGPPPPKITEAHTDAHILGVILVQQYGLKKGIELFGDN